jgi:hypothetical protein
MLLIEAFVSELAVEALHEAVLLRHVGRRRHGNLDIGVRALACELDLLLLAEDRIAEADQLLALHAGICRKVWGAATEGAAVTASLRASHGRLR